MIFVLIGFSLEQVLCWILVMVWVTLCQSMKVMPFHTPSFVWILLVVTSPMLWWRFWLREVTCSPPLLNGKLSVIWRRNLRMLPSTTSRSLRLPRAAPLLRRTTSFLMVRSSPSELRDSVAQKSSSSLLSLEWKLLASTRLHTTQSWSVMWILERICMVTLCSVVVPLCSLVLLTEWARRSPPLPQAAWRSRWLHHQRESTVSGLEDLSLLPSAPSSRWIFLFQ